MLETMAGIKSGLQDDANIPPADENTLFRMHSFRSSADIRDKGPNLIPLTITGTHTIGRNANGSYIDSTGSAYFAFSSELLNQTSFDITMIVSDIKANPGYAYPLPFLDARPNNTNGLYLSFHIYNNSANPPWTLAYTWNSQDYNFPSAPITATTGRITLVFKVRPGSVEVVNNGVSAGVSSKTITLAQQQWKVGKNAFITPILNFKLHYLDIKKV